MMHICIYMYIYVYIYTYIYIHICVPSARGHTSTRMRCFRARALAAASTDAVLQSTHPDYRHQGVPIALRLNASDSPWSVSVNRKNEHVSTWSMYGIPHPMIPRQCTISCCHNMAGPVTPIGP